MATLADFNVVGTKIVFKFVEEVPYADFEEEELAGGELNKASVSVSVENALVIN